MPGFFFFNFKFSLPIHYPSSLSYLFAAVIIQFYQENICFGLHLQSTWLSINIRTWTELWLSSAHADSLLSAALVIGINRMQGKCHAHSWIFIAWCCLLGRLKWWLCSKHRPSKKRSGFTGEIRRDGSFWFSRAHITSWRRAQEESQAAPLSEEKKLYWIRLFLSYESRVVGPPWEWIKYNLHEKMQKLWEKSWK